MLSQGSSSFSTSVAPEACCLHQQLKWQGAGGVIVCALGVRAGGCTEGDCIVQVGLAVAVALQNVSMYQSCDEVVGMHVVLAVAYR